MIISIGLFNLSCPPEILTNGKSGPLVHKTRHIFLYKTLEIQPPPAIASLALRDSLCQPIAMRWEAARSL